MFANLKLRNRMLVGYSVPIVLFIGLLAPVFSSASRVAEAFKQTGISINAIQHTDNMALALAKMARDYRGYVAVKDKIYLKDYEKNWQLFRDEAESVVKEVENPEQKERLKKMIELGKEFNEFASNISNLVTQGKQDEAVTLFKSRKGVTIVNDFDEINDAFSKKEQELLTTATSIAQSNINFMLQAVMVGALLGIAFALIAAFFISSGIAQTISQAVSAIASSAAEIATTVEQQERTAVQQSASVNQTTTTMDELGASSGQSAEQAEAAAVAARQVAQLVMRLSQQTNQIGEITNVVSELANQTNMLALNAAVEAVRAGDQGKGFGVVASEIRKLADQSKKSAERINRLILDIQTITAPSATVLGDITTTENIVAAINNIVVSSQQISLSSKQQAIAIQQVVEAMNALNVGAQENASGIAQTKVGTQNLNKAAQDLKALV